MQKIPKKVLDRFSALKTFQNIALAHKERDVSEADTVTLIKDIFSDVFGYDKYLELTSEQQIRGTYCDLAVKINNKIQYLIEIKSAGTTLNDSHLRQVVSYGANEGIEWVVLTNALDWKVYRIKFGQPINYEEVFSFNITEINIKSDEAQQKLFLLCREGINLDAMDVFHQHAQVLNRYSVATIALSDTVIGAIRREMRRIFPDAKITPEKIAQILMSDVFKRDVFEGDKAREAQSKIKKAISKIERATKKDIKPAKKTPSDEKIEEEKLVAGDDEPNSSE